MRLRREDLLRELSTLCEGGPPALTSALDPIRDALDADECVACEWIVRRGVPNAEPAGATSAIGNRVRTSLRCARKCPMSRDAPCPLAAGGAGVLAKEQVERTLSAESRSDLASSLAAAGFSRGDALRAVMAPEQRPVGCLAALRASGQFAPVQRALLGDIADALGGRVALERRLGAARFATAAMESALEAMQGGAFVITDDGDVVYANAKGRALLDDRCAETHEALAAVAHGMPTSDIHAARIASRGLRDHLLVVFPPRARGLTDRTAALSQRWKLTSRQAEVLERIALGDTNKEIATALRCTESTVEAHVTALLRKAGIASRAKLIALYWSAPDPA